MIFGNMSESLFLTILQRLQELYNEITAGRADSHSASSTLAAKLEHLTALQRQLEDSVRESRAGESPSKSANSTNYTTYYYMRGEGGDSGGEGEDGGIAGTSTPKVPSKTLRDHEAEIRGLGAELEELRRWNEALQARLDDGRKTRHVGVGMEKGGGVSVHTQTVGAGVGVSLEKYEELRREVDRLLEELEREKAKSLRDRKQQQRELDDIQHTLQDTEDKVQDLEIRLKAAMLKDVSTSTQQLEEAEELAQELDRARATVAKLRGQLDGAQRNVVELRGQFDRAQANIAKLKGQVEGAHGTIAELRGQLGHSQGSNAELRGKLDRAQRSNAELRGELKFENEENKRLREELADISINMTQQSPLKEGEGLTTSMPNLLASEGSTSLNKSDSWTSPPRTSLAECPDVQALKAKNEDITRLNAQLQRKCQEQLQKTPTQSRPSSAGQTSLSAKLRGTEEVLRTEMMERERALLSQLREAEARLLEKEAEWQSRVAGLRQEGVELEAQLAEAMKSKQGLRAKLMEGIQAKDEEILK